MKIQITFLLFLFFFFSCETPSNSDVYGKLDSTEWEFLGVHPDLVDSIHFTDQDIYIDSNWYQVDAATYGDLYRFYQHNHYLYQKGDQIAVKLGEIQDSNRIAFFEQRGDLLKQTFTHIGEMAPEFEFFSLQGKKLNSSQLKGKVIVFSFWFKNCIPCVNEIPELNQLVKDYANKDVVFIAPALDTAAELLRFLEKTPFTFHIIADQDPYIMEYDTPGYPTNVIIDKDGKIDAIYVGGQYKGIMSRMIASSIDKLLQSS